jgi:hypothetical protein
MLEPHVPEVRPGGIVHWCPERDKLCSSANMTYTGTRRRKQLCICGESILWEKQTVYQRPS